MMIKKISNVKIGDWIELDVGYPPDSEEEFCEVVKVNYETSVYDSNSNSSSNRISFKVKLNYLIYNTISFDPDTYISYREESGCLA